MAVIGVAALFVSRDKSAIGPAAEVFVTVVVVFVVLVGVVVIGFGMAAVVAVVADLYIGGNVKWSSFAFAFAFEPGAILFFAVNVFEFDELVIEVVDGYLLFSFELLMLVVVVVEVVVVVVGACGWLLLLKDSELELVVVVMVVDVLFGWYPDGA